MTIYYNEGKPYSIKNWNDLIEDVNEILENPPYESVDCPPVDPIELVEDPHIWTVQDVEEMRDKLKETCPDIEFEEELEVWKKDIIDEIVEEMDKAWCDCEGEEEDEDQLLCTYTRTDIEAGATEAHCCGNVITDSMTYCGLSHQSSWTGETAPVPQLDGEAAQAAYTEAYIAGFAFMGFINELAPMSDDIDDKQDEIDQFVSTMRAAISKYDAECKDVPNAQRPAHCPVTRQKICEFNTKALDAQAELVDLISDYADKRAEAMVEMEKADAAALANSSNMLSWEGRFPPDHNVLADCIAAAIPKWAWWDWWDPRHMTVIGDAYAYSRNQPSVPGNGVLASVSSYKTIKTGYPGRHWSAAALRLSPNGNWYITGTALQAYVRDYSAPYQTKGDRYRCTAIFEIQCENGETCGWEPWSYQTWIWSQGWGQGFGQWIWQPLPERDEDDYWSDTWHIIKRRQAGMRDNSEKRDEWLDLYSKTEGEGGWYEEHPEYTGEEAEFYC